MKTLKINPKKFSQKDLKEIVSVLEGGGVVLLPTETVYTFATDATKSDLVKKVYDLKGRDFKKPMHVVFESIQAANHYVVVSKQAQKLAHEFLPGPLTLVLPKKKDLLPDMLTSGLPTLGVRVPNLKLCLDVAKKFGKPYTTTSANLSGGINPYSISEVLNQLDENKKQMVDLIVDTGNLPHLLPSTLLDLTTKPPTVLREGPITKTQIAKVLGGVAN